MVKPRLIDITQEELHKLFEYRDGQLFNRVHRSANAVIGGVAGTKCKSGYVRLSLNGRSYMMHRIIYLMLNGVVPSEIDHINRDNSDNRIENLRAATKSENCRNRRPRGSSKFIGVCWHKHRKDWAAGIRVNKKIKHLGYFAIEEDAARAYDKAAREHFPEFANYNFKDEQ